jgi:hypothetical protein
MIPRSMPIICSGWNKMEIVGKKEKFLISLV